MKLEVLGAYLVPIQGELTNLAQGTDKLILPCGWWEDLQFNSGKLFIFAQGTTTVAHAFTFFKNGSTSLGTVTLGVGATYAQGTLTLPAGGLTGLTDYVSVRHDTNAQNANESSSHTDEGGRIWAGLIPDRIQ